MSYPINYPTPQGANIQIFETGFSDSDWVKPQGASFVWFTLIGAGADGGYNQNGDFGGGGGSGAVTNFMCPAFLIPDQLKVVIGKGGGGSATGYTKIIYQQKDGTGYELLTARTGTDGGTNTTGSGAGAMTANYFTAMGFFQSVAGQAGASGGQSASTTTFLSGGAGSFSTSSSNYDYNVSSTKRGFFMMQPVIVGISNGGQAGSVTAKATSAIGCGGSAGDSDPTYTSKGGDGMAVIITW